MFVRQLIDALTNNLANYAATMPDGMVIEEEQ